MKLVTLILSLFSIPAAASQIYQLTFINQSSSSYEPIVFQKPIFRVDNQTDDTLEVRTLIAGRIIDAQTVYPKTSDTIL